MQDAHLLLGDGELQKGMQIAQRDAFIGEHEIILPFK